MDSVLIRYHEIALKKGNRAYFTELLKRNVISAVKDLGVKDIRSLPARLLLTLKNDIDQAPPTERRETGTRCVRESSILSTLRLDPRPWRGALAQDSAPRAYWKVPRACPWGSTIGRSPPSASRWGGASLIKAWDSTCNPI